MPPKCKITVLNKNLNSELARDYCQNEVNSCPVFEEGQEFIAGSKSLKASVTGRGMIFTDLWQYCFQGVIFPEIYLMDG